MRNDSLAFPPPDLEQAFSYATLGAEGFKKIDTPVNVHVHSVRKRLTDADGLSAKAVIDGLVLTGLLEDDSFDFVKEVSYSQEKGETEYTVITITEARLAGVLSQ
jgi:hypothetical protein